VHGLYISIGTEREIETLFYGEEYKRQKKKIHLVK